jgi:molybdenum cofactor cytidylyltransferase
MRLLTPAPVWFNINDMIHAGIVLAAGASERMGQPKALLPMPGGILLAHHQADLLAHAGCARVVIVLGSDYDFIGRQLSGCQTVRNANWKCGRFSSVQAGLRVLKDFDGCFILPVDTVGVAPATLEAIRKFAEENAPSAVRPTFGGKDGKIMWISNKLADELLRRAPDDRRLDHFFETRAGKLAVNDPAILNNVNTPEEWERLRHTIR